MTPARRTSADVRIDVLSIFPDYLAPLDLSLVGRARRDGLLRLEVHDLRDWATDRHRTVDDTPVGGGAGMVMRADVWGAALDAVLATDGPTPSPGEPPRPILLVPTPAGAPLTQSRAQDLADELGAGTRLVIACGRYEGIDSRVAEHYAAAGLARVQEYSIGDYVLGGGEVAALVLVEAVARLLPGVVGNPESLVEESHGSAGLLEGPVYTRPLDWRGLIVPEVLRSGHHGRIARWRRDRGLERTAARRPDLLDRLDPGSLDRADKATLASCGWVDGGEGRLTRFEVRDAVPDDAAALAALAGATFPLACPPGVPVADVAAFVAAHLSPERWAGYLADPVGYVVVVAEAAARRPGLLGYVLVVLPSTADAEPVAADVAAAFAQRPAAELSKCYVVPGLQGTGLAGALLEAAHDRIAARTVEGHALAAVWLGTNRGNRRAQRFYRRHGYTAVGRRTFRVGDAPQEDLLMVRRMSPSGGGLVDAG